MTAETNLQPVLEASAAELDAARYYEEKFVPSLFQPWCKTIIEASAGRRDDRVLDIACGTGVVLREMARSGSDESRLAGIDLSPGMIEIAAWLQPRADWQVGDACALPYADNRFDRVLCQFGLMFFPERVEALREMQRVAKPGGKIAILVWNEVEHNPGFARVIAILQKLAGTKAADALRAPFCLGGNEQLHSLAGAAGMRDFSISTHRAEAAFVNLREFIDAELRGWLPIMDVHLEEDQIGAIYRECQQSLGDYMTGGNGALVMPVSAQLLTADACA